MGAEPLKVEPVLTGALEVPAIGFRVLLPTGAATSRGGTTMLFLYAAVGDNRVVIAMTDDTAHAPVLRADLVAAQLHRLVTAGAMPPDGTPGVTA